MEAKKKGKEIVGFSLGNVGGCKKQKDVRFFFFTPTERKNSKLHSRKTIFAVMILKEFTTNQAAKSNAQSKLSFLELLVNLKCWETKSQASFAIKDTANEHSLSYFYYFEYVLTLFNCISVVLE